MSPLKMFIGGLVCIGMTLAIVNVIFFQKPGTMPVTALSDGAEPPTTNLQPLSVDFENWDAYSSYDAEFIVEEPRVQTKPVLYSIKHVPGASILVNMPVLSTTFFIGLIGLFLTWLIGPGLIRLYAPPSLRRARR